MCEPSFHPLPPGSCCWSVLLQCLLQHPTGVCVQRLHEEAVRHPLQNAQARTDDGAHLAKGPDAADHVLASGNDDDVAVPSRSASALVGAAAVDEHHLQEREPRIRNQSIVVAVELAVREALVGEQAARHPPGRQHACAPDEGAEQRRNRADGVDPVARMTRDAELLLRHRPEQDDVADAQREPGDEVFFVDPAHGVGLDDDLPSLDVVAEDEVPHPGDDSVQLAADRQPADVLHPDVEVQDDDLVDDRHGVNQVGEMLGTVPEPDNEQDRVLNVLRRSHPHVAVPETRNVDVQPFQTTLEQRSLSGSPSHPDDSLCFPGPEHPHDAKPEKGKNHRFHLTSLFSTTASVLVAARHYMKSLFLSSIVFTKSRLRRET